jgi:Chalcone isomerase-like
MRFKTCLSLAAVLVAGLAAPAAAGEKAGIKMPDKMEVAGKTVTLNGLGLREATILKIDVYVAGLYLETVSSDPAWIVQSNQVKRLILHFKRDVGRKDIVKAWNDGFRKNATVERSKIQAQIDQLDAWMVDFKDGELLTFTFVPAKGVQVHVGARLAGTLQGDDFARSLLSIWLGPHPPNSALKKGLLGTH